MLRFSLAGRPDGKGAGKAGDGDAGKEDDGCDDSAHADWGPHADRVGGFLYCLLREALAIEGPKLRKGALAQDELVIQSSCSRPSYDDRGSRSILP